MQLNTTKNNTIQLKTEQKTWIDIFPKKTYRRPTGTWKYAEHCKSSGEWMQVKTTTKHHHTICENGSYQKTPQITDADEDVEKRERSHSHGWWECKLAQLLWEIIWRFLKKLKMELLCDPATPALNIYPKKILIEKIHALPCSLRHYL